MLAPIGIAPGMLCFSGREVLCGCEDWNRELQDRASAGGGIGEERKAKSGTEVQVAGTTPAWRGNPAMDGDAQSSSGHARRSNRREPGAEPQLSPGDLSQCRVIRLPRWQQGRGGGRSPPTPL